MKKTSAAVFVFMTFIAATSGADTLKGWSKVISKACDQKPVQPLLNEQYLVAQNFLAQAWTSTKSDTRNCTSAKVYTLVVTSSGSSESNGKPIFTESATLGNAGSKQSCVNLVNGQPNGDPEVTTTGGDGNLAGSMTLTRAYDSSMMTEIDGSSECSGGHLSLSLSPPN